MNWKTAYLESRVLAASPVELIEILYEYAIQYVEAAREDLARGDIEGRSRAVSKAAAIIGELEGSLDYSAGGEIAANLARLYRYMQDRLMAANLRQEGGPLAEVESLLKTLGEAWKAVSPQSAGTLPGIAEVPSAAMWSSTPTFDLPPGQSAFTWSA